MTPASRLPGGLAPGPTVTAVSAATMAGVALWISRASFDVAGTTAAPERIAMLPSLPELAGLVCLALLLAAGMAWLLPRRGDQPEGFWVPVRDALLPLFGLSLLMLPYLPWFPDWVPAVRLLAGPARWLMWIVIIGQVLWLFVSDLVERTGASPVVTPSNAGVIFGFASVLLSAPFILNVRVFPEAFVELFDRIRLLPSTGWSISPQTALAVLLDQEFGMALYAPVLLLAFVGLAGMVRVRSHRRVGILLAVACIILIILPAMADPWWHRSMMPGRPVLVLLPVLIGPIAWLYTRAPRASLSRAGMQLLLLVSMAITLAFARDDEGLVVAQQGDGVSSLLQWMSPTWQLWREAPSYVAGADGAASARVLLWLVVLGFAGWIFSRRSAASPGHGALRVTIGLTSLCFVVVSASAAVLSGPSGRFDVEARGHFPLLETFDPIARPIAIRYDPFSRARLDELPPAFVLSAVPGQRTGRQPVRVVLNARFRLPAGAYVLDLKGSTAESGVRNAKVSLQIGREGNPLETWQMALAPGERAQHHFDVPIDAEFVGFRASRQVEAAIAELRVSPSRVVNRRRRFRAARVLSASAFDTATVFFHDGHAYAEREGFWVKGRETAHMTVMKSNPSRTVVTVAIHSGARPNTVTVSTTGWSQQVALVPGVTKRLSVPSADGDRFVPLTISCTGGFVPAQVEQNSDERLLGAWVAFVPGDIAQVSER